MNTLNINVPASWAELTQKQLGEVFVLMVRYNSETDGWMKVAVRCALRWNGIRVISPFGNNFLIDVDGEENIIDAAQMANVLNTMAWLAIIPETPVRLDHIDGAEAMPADPTYDLTFEQWLACDNLYQGYQFTQDPDLLRSMAAILYRKEDIKLQPSEEISIFYWWAAVKQMVSGMFPNFFQPAPVVNQDIPDSDTIRRMMDAQIRALTKGDISKEDQILSMPAIRAITELDAQAKEYHDLNKKYPSNQ